MLLFGHIGITLGIFFVFSYIAPRLKTIIDRRYLVVGALLPDLIDKPLGLIVFASTISNGRMTLEPKMSYVQKVDNTWWLGAGTYIEDLNQTT